MELLTNLNYNDTFIKIICSKSKNLNICIYIIYICLIYQCKILYLINYNINNSWNYNVWFKFKYVVCIVYIKKMII